MSTYSALVLATTGIADYWRLGEAAPGPYADSQGSLTLTQTGSGANSVSSLITSDPANAALGPNGSGILQTAANFAFGSAFSIECWTNPGTISNNNGLVGAWAGPGSMLASGAANSVSFYIDGVPITGAMTNSVVSHVVGTYDGTNMRLYVNASLVAGPTAHAAPTAGGVPFQVSGYGGNQFRWTGSIDEVALYTVAISSTDVTNHYNAGIAAPSTGGGIQVIII